MPQKTSEKPFDSSTLTPPPKSAPVAEGTVAGALRRGHSAAIVGQSYRPLGHFILVALFAMLTANAWSEALDIARGKSDGPMALFWLQLVAGALAVASMTGVWRRAKWAPYAIAGWGIESASLIVLLGPLLALDAEASLGLWVGAAIMLSMAAGTIWYLRRSMKASSTAS